MSKLTVQLDEIGRKGLIARFVDNGGFGGVMKTKGVPVKIEFTIDEESKIHTTIELDDAKTGHRESS